MRTAVFKYNIAMTTQPEQLKPPEHSSLSPSVARFEWKSQSEAPTPEANEYIRSTVKIWKDDKGFGFITPEDQKGDAFLHASVIDEAPKVGDKVFVLRIDNNDPKGRKVLEAVSERGKRGREFMARVRESQTLDQFVVLPVSQADARQGSGVLTYTDAAGQNYSLRYAKRDYTEGGRGVPSKLRIPDPARYPELYKRTDRKEGQPGSLETLANGLVISDSQYTELQREHDRHQEEQQLQDVFKRPESLSHIQTLFTERILSGDNMDTRKQKVRLTTDVQPVIEAKLQDIVPTFDPESQRFRVAAKVEFFARRFVGSASASRVAEVSVEGVKPEYDVVYGQPVRFQGSDGLKTFEQHLRPKWEVLSRVHRVWSARYS